MSDTPKKRRWLVPALVISLALNLLVVGIVIGAITSGGKHRGGHDGGPARGFIGEPFLRALPQEHRRALAEGLRENPVAMQETREALRERVQNLLTVLRSDPFDAETAARLLSEQRTLVVDRQKHGEGLLLERLSAMSADERSAYADKLEKALKHLNRRRR